MCDPLNGCWFFPRDECNGETLGFESETISKEQGKAKILLEFTSDERIENKNLIYSQTDWCMTGKNTNTKKNILP